MKQKILSKIISAVLILLFVYAAISKIMDFQNFRIQMLRQPFPDWLANMLTWALPPGELIIAGWLATRRTRLTGLYCSMILLISFTGYVALMLTGAFGKIPCACGGVFASLGWNAHLLLNILFALLALLGIMFEKNGSR